MPAVQIVCPRCDTVNVGRWIPDTRVDPGYYDGPEECESCGHELADDGTMEPYDPREEEADSLYDLMNDR